MTELQNTLNFYLLHRHTVQLFELGRSHRYLYRKYYVIHSLLSSWKDYHMDFTFHENLW